VKIEGTTEMIFAQAVALSQNGKMKSTIHVGGKEIFILNMDNTIWLRFISPQEFPEPFSFFANDYESPRIRIEDGKIVFVTNQNGIRRTKVCSPPKMTFAEAKAIWAKFSPSKDLPVILQKEMNTLLDESLSHIEVSKEAGKPVKLLQRDIYNGARVEVEKNASGGSLLDVDDEAAEFGPIGLRTVDFGALFSLTDALTWFFQPEEKPWAYIEDNTGTLSGVVGLCLYDELGDVARPEGD